MRRTSQERSRRAAASVDYFLVMGVILPMAALTFYFAPRIMALVYEMTAVLVSWPFM